MLGVLDPFTMEMSHQAFLYWQVYREMKLLKFHDKNEYYYARIIQALYALGGNEINIKNALMEFEEKDPETEMIKAMDEADAFIR